MQVSVLRADQVNAGQRPGAYADPARSRCRTDRGIFVAFASVAREVGLTTGMVRLAEVLLNGREDAKNSTTLGTSATCGCDVRRPWNVLLPHLGDSTSKKCGAPHAVGHELHKRWDASNRPEKE